MFNRKKNHPKREEDNQEAMARKIANRLINLQVRIARFLNKRTAHYTQLQKQIFLVMISMVFSVLCLYLIFQSLF